MIDRITLIYIRNGKVLSTLSKNREKYYLPGGIRDPYENDVETLIRETKEELSVSIDINSIRYYGVFKGQADARKEGTIVKSTCYTADIIGKIKPANEIKEIIWLTLEDIEKVSKVDQILLKDLHERKLIL